MAPMVVVQVTVTCTIDTPATTDLAAPVKVGPMPRRKPSPMDEENFPTRSPTRDAVEREMREPSNVRGPAEPAPKRKPPVREMREEEGAADEDLAGLGRDL